MQDSSRPTPDLGDLSQRSLEDHRRLMRTLKEVEAPQTRLDADRLGDLQVALERHFDNEEQEEDGLFAVIEERAVHLHRQVEELKADHLQLRQELADLCARAKRRGAQDQQRLRHELAAFTKSLRAHESRETELFVDSWNDDLGEKD